MRRALILFFSLIFATRLGALDPCCSLFEDLRLVEKINKGLSDELPFFYNNMVMGGYFTMPSARFPKLGDIAFAGSSVSPYALFGVNFAPFSRIELSANYRVYLNSLESNFGKEGFGEDADRIGNVKFGILMPEDGFEGLPFIAFGLDDCIGTKRFNSQYFVMTKTWMRQNVELSVGWGRGRIKGFFGGAAWTPFRQTKVPLLKNVSLLIEYDANDYKHHPFEHNQGRSVKNRLNPGVSYVLGDTLQASISWIRGEEIAGSISLRYPLGTSKGLFPKIDDPSPYVSPVDTEPLGPIRPEVEFAHDLACSFADQGLDLYDAYLFYNGRFGKQLWLKVVNNRYRQEPLVRERIEDLLAALVPSDIASVQVVIEAQGVVSHRYSFRTQDLNCFRTRNMGAYELATLAPMIEADSGPSAYESCLLFERQRRIWTTTLRPRVINFFGATTGKFKYSLGLLGSVDGIFKNGLFYRLQASYSAYSSMHGLTSRDRLNPSDLLHVRTDSVRYFQGGSARLEELYLQKAWNLGKGCFFRLAAGYFEPAYGGGAAETLLYPVQSNWAFGLEAASVLKRQYQGVSFVSKVSRFNAIGEEIKEPFVGLQYFFNLHYDFKPLDLLFKIQVGQFLAKDKGARFQVTRFFPSGARFSLWLTLTNGNDKVNGHVYFDKGFAFTLPFDMFLKQSSRSLLTYAMSAWLRDVGAQAATGVGLYPILYEERFD